MFTRGDSTLDKHYSLELCFSIEKTTRAVLHRAMFCMVGRESKCVCDCSRRLDQEAIGEFATKTL